MHHCVFVYNCSSETLCSSVSQVAEAFLQLVMDETKNGEALMVTSAGKNYMTFPEFK